MEFSNELSASNLPSEYNIRHLQLKIQYEIKKIEKDVSELTSAQTFNLCNLVKDWILTFEDEPQLSKIQNDFRRIYIASELIAEICSAHERIVDLAFTKIINDLLCSDKYKIISSKITHKICSNLKKEKYFAKEAHTKLLKSLKDNDNMEEKEETARKVQTPEKQADSEKEPEVMHSELHHAVDIEKEIPLDKIQQTLIEDSLQFNLIGDMTEVRIEPPVEVSNLNIQMNLSKDTSLQPPEISIREPFLQQPVEEDIIDILQNGNIITNIRKSGLDENLFESVDNVAGAAGQIENMLSPSRSIEKKGHSDESIEEWSLSTLESVEIPQKKYLKSKTDELTTIPNYSIRAMNLNKNIEIQRVQVFEGPPKILQSMSSGYLMQTSGFKRFTSQNVRGSILTTLYKRHLRTETRPTEPFKMPTIQKRETESKIKEPEVQLQESVQLREGQAEVGEKIGMRAASKSGTLTELVSEKKYPEVSAEETLEKSRLIGLPMSKITSPPFQPPEKEKINGAIPTLSPRIQQLQGTVLDPKKDTPTWFFVTKENPPRAEFREFSYVKNKLHNYWTLFEMHGMEKSVSIREFLLFEENYNFANYLTVLRIVDKLSIQRQLFLDCKNGDILIEPFENPYVSKNQVTLKEKE